MAEEIPAPEQTAATADPASATEPEASNPKSDETLTAPSCEATTESKAHGGTATESSCSKGTSDLTSDGDREKSLQFASELMEKGSAAVKEGDFSEASDCYSRALEIRVAHYGELSVECVNPYYKYGCALLYKAQEEADPLVTVPKKDGEPQQDDGSVRRSVATSESTTASALNIAEQNGNSTHQEGAEDDGSCGKTEEDGDEESDDEDLAEADEDESDLDLAWKMLDVARAIIEKHSQETMEKVDVLSALAEVALEREDVETSLSDYLKALSILERLVEPDSRHLAELNFRICLCLEIGSKAEEGIPYCQKAISICKSRVARLMEELKGSSGSAATSADSQLSADVQPSGSNSITTISDKEAEIKTLNGLSSDLEKKLEDLQQAASTPTPILSDILAIMSAKAKSSEKNASAGMSSSRMGTANSSNGNFDSPTVSGAHINGAAAGVTHLGVVGRGVKRVQTDSGTEESGLAKRPALNSSPQKGEDNAP